MKAAELSPKRQRFVDEYLIDLDGKHAAIRAKYSAKTAEQTASRLLRDVKIAAAVQVGLAKRSERTKVDQNYVITNLLEIVERCMQRTAITDSAGEETGVWKFDARGATGAIKLLGEHLGMFNQKAPEGTNDILAGLIRDFVRGDVDSRAAARRQAEQPGEVGPSRLTPALAEPEAHSVN